MISNIQLTRKVKQLHLPDFKGCYSKDELPSPLRSGYYIINMQNATTKSGKSLPGTHWVFLEVGKSSSCYVDSFGIVPPTEIVEAATKPIYYNSRQVQDLHSDLCGYYCLYFYYQHAINGRTYRDIAKDFKTFPRTDSNYQLLDDFFNISAK